MIKQFGSFKEINNICRRYDIERYTINSDDSVDVRGNVSITERKELTKLPLKFNRVAGAFHCFGNRLTSLEGAPEEVIDFYCQRNKLTSLEGAPEKVGGSFICRSNKLTSLEGAPRKIRYDFNCQSNKIWTFEGAPDYISGYFYCDLNPIWEIWRLFEDYSKMEFFNDCDPIREIDGQPAIILERLNEFLTEIGEKPVEKVKGYLTI